MFISYNGLQCLASTRGTVNRDDNNRPVDTGGTSYEEGATAERQTAGVAGMI
jgi:hypothetical protein